MKRSDQSAPVALLVDGTRLFFKTKEMPGRQLDYEGLNRHLLHRCGAPAWDHAIFFTTFDPANEGQAKFLGFIEKRVGWTVERHHVKAVDPAPSEPGDGEMARGRNWLRFDAHIAFSLGRLARRGSRICVVSDSYPLEPIIRATRGYGAKVQLAFFGSEIDPRWLGVVREPVEAEDFIDLDDIADDLFGVSRERRTTRRPLAIESL